MSWLPPEVIYKNPAYNVIITAIGLKTRIRKPAISFASSVKEPAFSGFGIQVSEVESQFSVVRPACIIIGNAKIITIETKAKIVINFITIIIPFWKKRGQYAILILMDNRYAKIVFGAIGGFIIIAALVLIFGFRSQQKNVTLEFWGFDDGNNLNEIIAYFNTQYPKTTINYTKKSLGNFEREWLNALAAGRGPDVFMLPSEWLLKHSDKLYPAPAEILDYQNFRGNFVDVAVKDMAIDGRVYATPLFMDTLVLYYNIDLFNKAGIAEPPKTWDDFLKDAALLTMRSAAGDILQSGAALGVSKNIDNASDILKILMLQNGVKMVVFDERQKPIVDFHKNEGVAALNFYVQFSDPRAKLFEWTAHMPNSLEYFTQNKLGMIFDYSGAREEIVKKSPNLNFSVAQFPQLKDASKVVNYANYWGLSVSLQSAHPTEAWQFAQFITRKESSFTYLEKTKRPSARRDLIPGQQADLNMRPFANQALAAVSFYEPDKSALDGILRDMIDLVNNGYPAKLAAEQGAAKFTQLIVNE